MEKPRRDLKKPCILGKTGLSVGRLGLSGGYGAPAEAFEMAFERGCNYFYHGSFRKLGMTQAIKNLCAQGYRDKLVIVAQIYIRFAWYFRYNLHSFLRKTGLDQVDVLLLGWFNSEPSAALLDLCAELKEKRLFRYLGISGHNREMFGPLAEKGLFDLFHIRYNAAHRGAEQDVFPRLPSENRPGIAIYTATRWGNLLDPKRMPPHTRLPRGSDCYRFVLSNPQVDVCLTGPKNKAEMVEALATIDRGEMTPAELEWMTKVGDHLHPQNPFIPRIF